MPFVFIKLIDIALVALHLIGWRLERDARSIGLGLVIGVASLTVVIGEGEIEHAGVVQPAAQALAAATANNPSEDAPLPSQPQPGLAIAGAGIAGAGAEAATGAGAAGRAASKVSVALSVSEIDSARTPMASARR